MLRGRYALTYRVSPFGQCSRTALVAYLAAKSQGGQFILRLEDSRPRTPQTSFIEAILAELQVGLA
ncbi:MAG: glutamate--tRNA ligase family protein [Deinococcales bacterium]